MPTIAVAIDELNLTNRLLAAAAALAKASSTHSKSLQPQLVAASQAASAAAGASGFRSGAEGGSAKPKGSTAVPQGPTSAFSAEAPQEEAMPQVVPTPGTTPAAAAAAAGAGGGGGGGLLEGLGGDDSGVIEGGGDVQIHYNSHLTLFDASNKQATFM
jgi:hypothetical protein